MAAKLQTFISLLVLQSCRALPLDTQDPTSMTRDELAAMFGIDMLKNAETAERMSTWTLGDPVNADELGQYYQSDILVLPGEQNGVVNEDRKWPNGDIPYTFYNEDFTDEQKADIMSVMADYEELSNGCIRFREREESDGKDFVFFTTFFAGCFALIGKRPNVPNIVNYGPGCTDAYGTIQHEMFHMLGFYHEHARTDRDDYVIVKWENIEKGRLRAYNFIKYPDTVIDPQGEEYDYGSVMHYSRTAFSYDGIHETLVPFNPPTAQIGQRDFLSDSDVRRLNKLYESECPNSGVSSSSTSTEESDINDENSEGTSISVPKTLAVAVASLCLVLVL